MGNSGQETGETGEARDIEEHKEFRTEDR